MIDTQAIRKKILDLALRGKLTEQLQEDGTAEELFQRIQQEKQALIDKGQIREEKPLPNITEDEIPFDTPSNWKWVRHNSIFDISGGSQPAKDYFVEQPREGYIQLYQIRDYGDKPQPVYIPINMAMKTTKKGDILLARYGGSLGKVFWAEDGAYNVAMAKIVCLFDKKEINENYLYFYYLGPIYQAFIQNISRSAQSGFNRDDLRSLLFPMPPLAEQNRIVAKIESIFPILDIINNLQNQYHDNLAVLKSKLIDAGIQGKLTEQLPDDGTAEELYQQIQQEKQALEKAGIIKKSKPLPPVSDEEKPFDIPNNWKWVRIGDVFTLQAGKSIATDEIHEEQSEHYYYPCYGGNGLRGYVDRYNVTGSHALIGRQGALCGNINFAEGIFYATEHAVVVYEYASTDTKWAGIMLKALNLNQYATSVAQPGLAVSKIDTVPIPLPPLAEQKRIVAKLEELLPLCKEG